MREVKFIMREVKRIELNDNDIITIIAEKYNVSKDNVVLSHEAIIEQYRKADMFLETHRWKWEGQRSKWIRTVKWK